MMGDRRDTVLTDNPPLNSALTHFSDSQKRRRTLWISTLTGIVILAVFLGVVLVPGSREEPVDVSEVAEAHEVPLIDVYSIDTDGDGLPDVLEEEGWETLDGTIYFTDPNKADTDGDGLTDGEEAGDLMEGSGPDSIYQGVSNPNKADSDDDGLDDAAEIHGWMTQRGDTFFTDPMNPDTDGDGLLDGDEAGEIIEDNDEVQVYSGFSDPTVADTDGDGLSDAEEADHGLDPYSADTDGDGLSDGREVNVIGTDPHNIDTDDDGFNDAFEVKHRERRGLDPLFEDIEYSTLDYASDFARGAFLGEASRKDSVAWLAGNLAVAGAGFLGVGGMIISAVSDLRDSIVLAIRDDWVGAGFSAMGLVATFGTAVKISKRVHGFISRYPHRAPETAGAIMKLDKVPSDVKIEASKIIWKNWDQLRSAGAEEKVLLRLQQSGRVNLDNLGTAMNRDGHVRGASARFMANGNEGEKHLENMLSKKSSTVLTQERALTTECAAVCNQTARIFDVVADGVAHESKVGMISLTESVRRQINSDDYLIRTGAIEGAHWHFYASAHTNQLGVSKPVLDLLEEKGIKFTVHLPVMS